jgi:pimeloyl-ACP methyl ester carboxylesterase
VLLLYRIYLKNSTKIKSSNGISSLEEVTLGNLKQWIFIRGTNRNNPILLFLHGGPGTPFLGMSSSRRNDKELIKYFTVVHWDQRGAGKSFNKNIPVNSMTYDRYVEDCSELIDYLCNRLQTPKLFIVAHSGGTVIGIKTVHKYPEKIHAYVGVAQSIDGYEEQKVVYDFLVEEAKKSGNSKKFKAIKATGPPPYDSPNEYLEQAGRIGHYGGFLADNSLKEYLKMGIEMLSFLISPEYSIIEGIRMLRNTGFNFTMNAIWEEMKNINLSNEIKSIKVPIYFFEGKYDMTTTTILVEKFYHKLNAEKGKKLIIFDHSGHLPMIEEKKKYEKFLIDVVLKDSRKKELIYQNFPKSFR